MPGLSSVLSSVFSRAFAEMQGGGTPGDVPGGPGGPARAGPAQAGAAAARAAAIGLRQSQRADFQVDGALALARSLRRPPREVAEEVLERANRSGLLEMCEKAEVAGPGFINLTLSTAFLARQLEELFGDEQNLGVPCASPALKVIVDYASPNAAKQMHVGHLRSTIIGDAIVRQLEFVGHNVARENHVGDWGATFGMLIEHLIDLGDAGAATELAVGDLEAFYQAARADYDNDPGFADRARARVVLLQSGDSETLELWEKLVERSLSHFDEAFAQLGTKLTREDVVGESFYKPVLPEVVAELKAAKLLVESDGALCVFPPGHTNRDGAPLPLIVQNSVGGYTYAATDLAALRDRTGRLGAQLLVYVVGLPQSQHFQMVFEVGRMMGWLGEGAEAVHVGFGNVLGPDGKIFRTRQGGVVKLVELLDEAVARAEALVLARGENSGPEKRDDVASIARAVGIGAVKYADLSTDRTRDYRFDWDRMLSLDGNTAPYIQYAHARVRSILRRAEAEGAHAATDGAARVWPVLPLQPEERELAKHLLTFGDAFEATLDGYSPHKLCSYLFELAGTFTTFYESCPVLRAPTAEARDARLRLSSLTGAVLAKGLNLLGIEAPERM